MGGRGRNDPAYGHLLYDVLNQNAALPIRGDEAEESWRAVTPVLEAWSSGLVPLEEYPASSDGPAGRLTRERRGRSAAGLGYGGHDGPC